MLNHDGIASSPFAIASSLSNTLGSSRSPECWNSFVTQSDALLPSAPSIREVSSEKARST